MLTKISLNYILKCSLFNKILLNSKMAKSYFEYVKKFELDDTLLPNSWIIIRLDGKCFHKFSEVHNFEKPNDRRALELMNYTAYKILNQYSDILMAYGQSDEYSFILKKECNMFKRRSAKLLTTINSTFSSTYVFYWSKFFEKEKLKYPPSFDGRIVLYPSDTNLIDYLKWRQADVHINNLYNTTFWNLVLKGKLTPTQVINFLGCNFQASQLILMPKKILILHLNHMKSSIRCILIFSLDCT